MFKRRQVKQTVSLGDRLAEEVTRLRRQATTAPHAIERERLLRKARQAETAINVNEWLASSGLQPPR